MARLLSGLQETPDRYENASRLEPMVISISENRFMTNEQECHWLMTEEAIEAIAMAHVGGILSYLQVNWRKFVNL